MIRTLFALLVLSAASPAFAQGNGNGSGPSSSACSIRMVAAPPSWIIEGYDPFGAATPEATFSVTFTNDSTAECKFEPVFELAQPPFGLSSGRGRQIDYTLVNLSQSVDATPRSGRSPRSVSRPQVSLAGNEARTLLFKLLVQADEVQEAGNFTEDVVLVAEDGVSRSLGGTPIVLGLNVLPSARVGLAGAYSVSNGRAVVDLGELRQGPAPVPLQLRVNSTGRYELSVSSANSGRLRLGASDWQVPYSVTIGGTPVDLAKAATLTGPSNSGLTREALPIHITVGDVSGQRAGTYNDVITVTVSPR